MIGAAFRPLGRGLRDTLDHLLPFFFLSISWWLGVFLIVTAPGTTLALFRAVDPRALEDHLRPTRRETLGLVRRWLLPGWMLAIAFAVPLGVLLNNIVVYRESDGIGRWLVPLWAVLLLLVVTAGAVTCSLVAVHERPIPTAIRRAVLLTLARSPRMLPLVVVLWVVVAIGGLLAVPAVMFIPPLVAVTINHLTYQALGIDVDDPLEPTTERLAEEQRSQASRYASN